MESEALNYSPEVNYDEATLEQQRKIEKDIAESQPYIGECENFDNLEQDYAPDAQAFHEKILDLRAKYSFFRRTRGDGNCFFRAFGFAYMEKLLHEKDELHRFHSYASKSKDNLVSLGFPSFTIEDFHDTFMEVLDKIQNRCTLEELVTIFNDPGYSDYLVVYLRLLVSGHLQKEADFFECFVEGGRTVKEFCGQEVEPMGKESDHIHITALTAATGVPVRIEYLSRGEGEPINHHDFPEGSTPKIHLLYKPGHYDILYCTRQ